MSTRGKAFVAAAAAVVLVVAAALVAVTQLRAAPEEVSGSFAW